MNLSIEINNKTKAKINKSLVLSGAEGFVKYFNVKKGVSIAFVGDKKIRTLNKKYRGIDKTTDVLAFPDKSKDFLGEVIIDYQQIKRQAKYFSNTVNDELVFILIHGLLHLMGYEDETKNGKSEMDALGKKIILKFN